LGGCFALGHAPHGGCCTLRESGNMGGLFGSEGEALTRGRSSVPRWGVATFSEWG